MNEMQKEIEYTKWATASRDTQSSFSCVISTLLFGTRKVLDVQKFGGKLMQNKFLKLKYFSAARWKEIYIPSKLLSMNL